VHAFDIGFESLRARSLIPREISHIFHIGRIPERKMVFAKNPFWERELLACNKFNIYEE